MNHKTWTTENIAEHILSVAGEEQVMPTNSFLQTLGRSDLSNAISKNGGFVCWADRLGLKRARSCSDIGWEGELAVQQILETNGFEVRRESSVKAPFDLLVEASSA